MGWRRAGHVPVDEAAAIEQFLRELKRDSPADWMTGAPDHVRRWGCDVGGFWSETDEDYGVGPTGPIGSPRVQLMEGR